MPKIRLERLIRVEGMGLREKPQDVEIYIASDGVYVWPSENVIPKLTPMGWLSFHTHARMLAKDAAWSSRETTEKPKEGAK